MKLFYFLRENSRWLLGGLLLTFFSSFGQTFFIALFAGEIRSVFALSHGDFGALYMAGTLCSALTLLWLGRVVDHQSVARVAFVVILLLSFACVLMGLVRSVWMLVGVIFLLRLFGQGMMTHIAMTAMGRWYVKERGRAVSLTTMGHQLGEGLLPLVVVGLVAVYGWRHTWFMAAALLLVVAAPAIVLLMRIERTPLGTATATEPQTSRQWTRGEVVRDPVFWILCLAVLAPSFIGTSFLFHQVHIGEVKHWSRTLIPGAFVILSMTTISFTLAAGFLVDHFSARRLLPLFLVPMGIGCLLLASTRDAAVIVVFMMLLGVSYGSAGAMFGALWPELYGARHLGSIRSLAMAAMVLASAVGPGLTGWLIDRDVGIETQLWVMGLYCLLTATVMVPVSIALGRRGQQYGDLGNRA
ncbi:MAG: MFS transporter [Granulosicoccus sp.]|nr:MFS transporter [Granulosicoccus sp.]